MKRWILFLLAGLLLMLSACAGDPPETAAPATADTTAPAAATSAEADPEPADYTGKEESLAFFSEEGTLEKKGAQAVRSLSGADDLAPYASYFSEKDLAAAKQMLEKDGETLLVELYVDDPTCFFHLQTVAPESDFILVTCMLEHPSGEEEETPEEHGLHLFFVIHLDEGYRQGLPLQFQLLVE